MIVASVSSDSESNVAGLPRDWKNCVSCQNLLPGRKNDHGIILAQELEASFLEIG